MGISPAEVRLRRLLAAAPQQTNPTKMLHYIAAMREQLVTLKGESLYDDLPVIAAADAMDYEKRIDELAEKIGASTSPNVWDSLRMEGGNSSGSIPVDGASDLELSDSVLASQALSPTLRRRRLQREQEEGRDAGTIKLDTVTNELVDKHRQIQEALTDEMALLSEQMKKNSLMMEQSLKETERVLDRTDEAVEYSLSATNRANMRAGLIYKSSWKTTCLTWLMLFLMCTMFIFMIVVIKITK